MPVKGPSPEILTCRLGPDDPRKRASEVSIAVRRGTRTSTYPGALAFTTSVRVRSTGMRGAPLRAAALGPMLREDNKTTAAPMAIVSGGTFLSVPLCLA